MAPKAKQTVKSASIFNFFSKIDSNNCKQKEAPKAEEKKSHKRQRTATVAEKHEDERQVVAVQKQAREHDVLVIDDDEEKLNLPTSSSNYEEIGSVRVPEVDAPPTEKTRPKDVDVMMADVGDDDANTTSSKDNDRTENVTSEVAGEDESESENESGDSSSDEDETTARSPPPPLVSPAGENEATSSYELMRQRNIARNKAFLASLGISKPEAAHAVKASKARPKGGKRPARSEAPRAATRRSGRLVGEKANVSYGEDVVKIIGESDETAAVEEQLPEDIDYDDSTVLKYIMEEGDDSEGVCSEETVIWGEDEKPHGFRQAFVVGAKGLSAIYSMDFSPPTEGKSLLAAGGKGGCMAVFKMYNPTEDGTKDEEVDNDRTLLNFKGHEGWVAGVQFLPGRKLLSAGNDGVVKLWNLAKTSASGFPELLTTARDLHTTRGVFGIHYLNGIIATGGKDKTVVLSRINESSGAIQKYAVIDDDYHTAAVKDVRFRDEHTLASVHPPIRVTDLRTPTKASATIHDIHNNACHTVRWHPTEAHLLLSAGLDTELKLWDLRALGNGAVQTYRGHAHAGLSKYKAICRPEFWGGGKVILACGERSDKLSMYDAEAGTAISRGVMGEIVNFACQQSTGPWSGLVASAHAGYISLLRAVAKDN